MWLYFCKDALTRLWNADLTLEGNPPTHGSRRILYFVSWKGPSEAGAKLWNERKLNYACRGRWHTSSSLKQEVLWPGWGKEIILAPEVHLMPLDISKGYYYGCHFKEGPVISGRVHLRGPSGIRGVGACGFAEVEIAGCHSCALWFKLTFPPFPNFVKALNPPKLGSVHSFANYVMWCKFLWSSDCGCHGGGAPRPSFLLHDSRHRGAPHLDQLPFLVGPFFGFGTKSSHSFGASSCSTLHPSTVNGICLLDPTLFSFLADLENSDRCLPAFILF